MHGDWVERVDRARWWAMQAQPFYGSLAMRLTDREAPDYISTAGTDGRCIYWNPAFVASLTDRELRFVLLHETLHCAHQHFWRLPLTAAGNMAGDHAINLTLLRLRDSGAPIDMPKDALADALYADMAEEEILSLMPPDPDTYTDACGGWSDPGDLSPEQLRQQWTQAVVQARMAAEAANGATPGDMARILAEATMRRIDWRQEMADFVRASISDRKDWARPSRRHATAPCITPRKRADNVGMVVFVRDTSGSVSDYVLAQYNCAIEAAMADTGCRGLLIDCDCRIGAEYSLGPGDSAPDHAIGGGGTDFGPAFARIEELDEAPAGVVYMTDLHGDFPEMPCEYPTLWLVSGDKRDAPFGRIVEIDRC